MAEWWRNCVVYQVYVKSFADSDGDGLGDLEGVRSRLPYLAGLGVDAVWLTPFYPSPLADGGYDVADYRDVDPRFGTLDGLRRARRTTRTRSGVRIIVDIVPNHCASSTRGSAPLWPPARAVRSGLGSTSGRSTATQPDVPPNDWPSAFGGPAWTRVTRPDGTLGRVVPAPVHAAAAGPELGQPGGRRRSSRTSCGSGSTGASTGSASTSPTALVKAPGYPRSARTSSRGCSRATSIRHLVTPMVDQPGVHDDLPGLAAGPRRLRRRADRPSARSGWATPKRSPGTCARTSCTRPSTSGWLFAPWDAAAVRDVVVDLARRERRRRSAHDLGAVQPRRLAPRLALRGRRPRPRPRSGSGAPHARPARVRLRLPG